MRRRAFLPLLCGRLLPSQETGRENQEIVDLVGRLAEALSDGSTERFMAQIERSWEGHAELERNIRALLAQVDVSSSVSVLRESGDEKAREVELDWMLELWNRTLAAHQERRRAKLTCRLERRNGKWRIVALEPVGFFGPRWADGGE